MHNQVRRLGVLAPPGNVAIEREFPLLLPPGVVVNHNRLSRERAGVTDRDSLLGMATSLPWVRGGRSIPAALRRHSACLAGVGCTAFGMAIAAAIPAPAMAQSYPTKPVRIVVASQAGGSLDLVARVAAQKLGAALGRSVVVENRPGAAGNIATELVAKSPADGYTLLAMSAAFTVNPSLFRKVPYDPVKDFDPVSMLATYMLFLVAHPSLPVRSVKELIALARARPGQINYASAATGTTTHIAGEMLASMTGVKMTHIPYKGTGSQLPAVIGGEVALAFGSTAVVPLVESGRLVLLGVSGAKRFPAFPNAPTIAEAGVPGFEVTSWNALFAPTGTPPAILQRLSSELARGLVQPDALEVFEKQGLQAAPGSPEALGAVVREEVGRWAKVIREANIPRQ